jgi:hypothetical protein
MDIVKELNVLRKTNKNKWVYDVCVYNGKCVSYKAYNTWVQDLNVDGVRYSSGMELSVKDYMAFLNGVFA